MWADVTDGDPLAGAAKTNAADQHTEDHPKRVRFGDNCKGGFACPSFEKSAPQKDYFHIYLNIWFNYT